MWSDTPEETKVWKGLAEAVHKKYPDITVKLETVTFRGLLGQAHYTDSQ
jgi:ABC-type glycerol-3-phosphate transport system substrate-binding protein